MAWAPEVPDPEVYRCRTNDGRIFLVATDKSSDPLAYGDLEMNDHIDHFYCRPDAVGTGMTAVLYDDLERLGQQRGIGRLNVEASGCARGFFRRKGFVEIERREFMHRGVAIHNYRMSKRLAAL
jgi:putative acetyltransferase